jgi:hypothetical protein
MTTPRRPSHANYDFETDHPRLTGERWLEGYAYAANGNVHNPTPSYRWILRCDGRAVDNFRRKRDLIQSVQDNAAEYCSNG